MIRKTIAIWLLIAAIFARAVCAQTDVGPLYVGFDFDATAPTSNPALQINGATEKVAFSFLVPKTGTIDAIGVRLGTVTQADELSVTVQTVGTNGQPSGSLYGSSAEGVITTGSLTSNTTVEATLGTGATAVAGEWASVVVEFDSFVDGDLQLSIFDAFTSHLPTLWHDSGSGYAQVVSSPMLYLHYDDATYVIPIGCVPPGGPGSLSIQSDTSPDEVAFQLTAPVAMRLAGLTFGGREFGSTAEVNFDVFNNNATPASLLTTPSVVTHDALSTNRYYTIALEPESLSESQVVTVGIFSEDATNNLQVNYFDVDNAAHWGNFMQGITWASRTRTDDTPNGGPAFTPLTTRKPLGGLWFDQITTTGGGGNVVDPLSNTIGP